MQICTHTAFSRTPTLKEKKNQPLLSRPLFLGRKVVCFETPSFPSPAENALLEVAVTLLKAGVVSQRPILIPLEKQSRESSISVHQNCIHLCLFLFFFLSICNNRLVFIFLKGSPVLLCRFISVFKSLPFSICLQVVLVFSVHNKSQRKIKIFHQQNEPFNG